jgi:DNA repair protein RadC
MNQYELEERYANGIVLKDAGSVYHEMRDIKGWEKEVFVAFYLDARNKVISREVISVGTLNASLIHAREVFRTAISRNADAVIIAHIYLNLSTPLLINRK